MREQLRLVVSPTQLLYPLGRAPVLVRSRPPRDLPVRDVAQKRVLEGVLRVSRDCGLPLAPHEVFPLERAQPTLRVGREGTDPEDLAVHRRVLEQLLLRARQGVEPR